MKNKTFVPPIVETFMLIQKYNAEWTENFQALKQEIGKTLHGIEYEIEHVGSTSVPQLAAKPIIDIDIIHQTKTDFHSIKSRLLKIGYYHNGDQGIPEREVFKRAGKSINAVLDTIPHHLYVCPVGSRALERHLLFRDFLRKNESARLEYETMKYNLAEEAGQNKKVYAALKERKMTLFINGVIKKTT